MSIADLRKQAQQTLREAEKAKEDLGSEADELLNSYLEILCRFVQESTPNASTRSNSGKLYRRTWIDLL